MACAHERGVGDRVNALIEKLRAGVDLSPVDIDDAVALVLSEIADAAEKAALLTALYKKG